MDKGLISQFWHDRSLEGRTRWTDERIFNFERSILLSLPELGNPKSILDLGSGFGELSLSLLGPRDQLTAVDMESRFSSGFCDEPRATFVEQDVMDYSTNDRFDLILLFGVVTYLQEQEEESLYCRIPRWLMSTGTAVIKHQCGLDGEIQVDGWSTELATRYQARYPHVISQRESLMKLFQSVEVISYPDFANKFTNTKNFMFVCKP